MTLAFFDVQTEPDMEQKCGKGLGKSKNIDHWFKKKPSRTMKEDPDIKW